MWMSYTDWGEWVIQTDVKEFYRLMWMGYTDWSEWVIQRWMSYTDWGEW
jgi:hypothetical protein